MSENEHAEKGHPVGALIMVLIIVALAVLGIGALNGGDTSLSMLIVPFFGGWGIYAVLGLAKD